jgi:hypothetical protein
VVSEHKVISTLQLMGRSPAWFNHQLRYAVCHWTKGSRLQYR